MERYSGFHFKMAKDWDPNPWAVCNAQDLEGDKFERCVQDVKGEQKQSSSIIDDITEEGYSEAEARRAVEMAASNPGEVISMHDDITHPLRAFADKDDIDLRVEEGKLRASFDDGETIFDD
jgi:hypothetical protein